MVLYFHYCSYVDRCNSINLRDFYASWSYSLWISYYFVILANWSYFLVHYFNCSISYSDAHRSESPNPNSLLCPSISSHFWTEFRTFPIFSYSQVLNDSFLLLRQKSTPSYYYIVNSAAVQHSWSMIWLNWHPETDTRL